MIRCPLFSLALEARSPVLAGASPASRFGRSRSIQALALLAILLACPIRATGAEPIAAAGSRNQTRGPSRGGPVVSGNQAPATWFAGPDRSAFQARFGQEFIDIADWGSLPDLTGSQLSCDSLTLRPASRPEHRTFFEIYQNRLYVRSENDTVHLNSWVIFHGGGSDLDSPYHVMVASGDPALDDTLDCAAAGTPWTVRPAGIVGSPIGLRSLEGVQLDPSGPFAVPPQSGLFPVFDPLSVFRAPTIGAYRPMVQSGKAYVVLRSQDAEGALDPSITSATEARDIADHVDQGFGTPEEIALRPRIMTFHVNRAPYLRLDDPAFVPQPDHVFPSRDISLNLLAGDDDPLDPDAPPPGVGGPSATTVLTWNVRILGFSVQGGKPYPVTVSPLAGPVSTPQIDLTVPDSLIFDRVVLEVELCDCRSCEAQPGSGRCATYRIPISVPNRGTPPLVVLDQAQGIGPIVRSPGGPLEIVTVPILDSLTIQNLGRPPRDTIPAQSRIEFAWHGEATAPDVAVAGYQYKLDEAAFVSVDPTVTSVSYNTGVGGDVIVPGTKVFFLRVVGSNGLTREINRRFHMNYDPDTWFAGPDTTALDARFGWSADDRHLDVANWQSLPDLGASFLSCDSLTMRPAERPERKTFFEIYGNRLYVRAENDTVHMNSWVVFHGGGADLDSPYEVLVGGGDSALDDTLDCAAAGTPWTVRPDGLVGSPIGMRWQSTVWLDPAGPALAAAQSLVLPNFDPTSVFRAPAIAAYSNMNRSGKAYLVLRSEDSQGGRDRSILNARQLADRVDGGIGTPQENALRRKIMTFHVNRAPSLRSSDPSFVPRPDQVFPTRQLPLNLLAGDSDSYDPAAPPGPGGPSASPILRWNVRLDGTDATGNAVSESVLSGPVFTPRIDVMVPSTIVGTDVTVVVELCDCQLCEDLPGSGRCAEFSIPISVPAGVTATRGTLVSAQASPARVRVRWHLGDAASARVERRSAAVPWSDVGEVRAGAGGLADFEDAAVEPGRRYGYRLAVDVEGSRETAGEVWVDVPTGLELAIEGLSPNPSRNGDLTVHFSLPTAEPARIEILDLAGRRRHVRELAAVDPGRHAVRLDPGLRLAPGIYLVRLVQGGVVRVARAAVLE